ncbi:hypothetical protein GCM10027184_75330 [Saccharothrix stipae]
MDPPLAGPPLPAQHLPQPGAHADGGCEHKERVVPAHIKGSADKPLVTMDRVHIRDTPPPLQP